MSDYLENFIFKLLPDAFWLAVFTVSDLTLYMTDQLGGCVNSQIGRNEDLFELFKGLLVDPLPHEEELVYLLNESFASL